MFVAFTVMVFMPTSNGTPAMLQVLVPMAVPDPPVAFVQVTDATPPLSCAVPFRASEVAEVVTTVMAGETIAMVGAGIVPTTGEGYKTSNVLVVVVPLTATAVIVTTLTPV